MCVYTYYYKYITTYIISYGEVEGGENKKLLISIEVNQQKLCGVDVVSDGDSGLKRGQWSQTDRSESKQPWKRLFSFQT